MDFYSCLLAFSNLAGMFSATSVVNFTSTWRCIWRIDFSKGSVLLTRDYSPHSPTPSHGSPLSESAGSLLLCSCWCLSVNLLLSCFQSKWMKLRVHIEFKIFIKYSAPTFKTVYRILTHIYNGVYNLWSLCIFYKHLGKKARGSQSHVKRKRRHLAAVQGDLILSGFSASTLALVSGPPVPCSWHTCCGYAECSPVPSFR